MQKAKETDALDEPMWCCEESHLEVKVGNSLLVGTGFCKAMPRVEVVGESVILHEGVFFLGRGNIKINKVVVGPRAAFYRYDTMVLTVGWKERNNGKRTMAAWRVINGLSRPSTKFWKKIRKQALKEMEKEKETV